MENSSVLPTVDRVYYPHPPSFPPRPRGGLIVPRPSVGALRWVAANTQSYELLSVPRPSATPPPPTLTTRIQSAGNVLAVVGAGLDLTTAGLNMAADAEANLNGDMSTGMMFTRNFVRVGGCVVGVVVPFGSNIVEGLFLPETEGEFRERIRERRVYQRARDRQYFLDHGLPLPRSLR